VNEADTQAGDALAGRVRSAVFWRSGTQIVAQIISWGSTLAVIRILDPSDYGLFAMTSVILVALTFLNGHGFASSLIQAETVDPIRVRQVFGMLLLLNVALALVQILVAPLAAHYYGQPQVAAMLRWQSLLYLATPFTVLPECLMSRNLEFRTPAIASIFSATCGAATAIGMALSGHGVWALVAAPIVIFWSRALFLTIATRFLVKPLFDFKGAADMFKFGGAILAAQGFWIIQSQSDVFIGARVFDPHKLGLYAEALFLTQIFATRFVPPLNEVAFPVYSRIRERDGSLSWSFLKAVRMIFLISCPVYFGLAMTTGPAVETLFGPKWLAMIPLVKILALAMPIVTLQILFAPAINALGKPGVTLRTSMTGAVLMPTVFLIAIRFGPIGLAWGWLIAFSVLFLVTFNNARSHIGINAKDMFAAVWPGLSTSAVMAALVWLVDQRLPPLPAPLHLATLALIGGISYVALLSLLARGAFEEVLRLVFRREAPAPIDAA
jgi:O-antigen/teichoic acid export membrane protein